MSSNTRSTREGGSAIVEFVLAVSLFWVPLFLGTLVLGFNLIRAIQVTQVCRDAAHMYSYGVDFTETSYQTLLANLAAGLSLTVSGDSPPFGGTTGSAVIILSTISYVDQTACTAGGYSNSACSNLNSTVFTRQIVIGNSALHSSAFGTPLASDLDSSGNVSSAGYLTHTGDKASNFSPQVLSLTSSTQFAYVAEMWVQSSNMNWWSFLGTPIVSSRAIF
ncbi:MAG: pilus assembly protein [Acidobacteriaceae bacterium]|nr:pilus assembly protein [Acidobacteriaceae bacterium]